MMKTILSNLTQKLSQLESRDLSQAEMENLVDDAKELYERLVVLRYKIYETNVLGPREEVKPLVSAHIEPISEVSENQPFDLFEMNVEEEVAEEVPSEEAEAHIVEFEETNEEHSELEVAMDLTEEVAAEHEVEMPIEQVFVEEVSHSNPIQEEFQVEELFSAEEPVKLELPEEPKVELVAEEVVHNQKPQVNVLDEIKDLETTSINSAWILQIEQSIRSDRSVFPLDTLIGSFSLNEKLQFINELFEGSSDAFSTATKKLNDLADMKEAREQLCAYATDHKWDLDSEIVEDFIFKICRRYAASGS
jgi:hypothetical protein